ncbi:alpha/beta hydrolase family protein [Methyloversatilis sp. RAC08]|uniref:alpha/beta fold hydrolase n=1 Tax=Methyloversatilis sp. RAC08 TaxID=1842540 RepID=UPI00083DD2BD|nr:alpha/beta hydrolase [Methyloversatilis sp. RAC08]AOF82485.1 alpha/beta hydrolase family protein [Methyloversatilis sp. RAC08]
MRTHVTFVLLPGLDGSAAFLRPLIDALPAWITPRVISYPRDGAQDYDTLLRHALAQTTDLDAYWLLGSSFGGPLALRMASADAARVRGLVLSTSFVRMPQPRRAKWAPFVSSTVIGALRTARRLPVWLGRRRSDPFRIAKAETWRHVSSHELAARIRTVMREDASAHLRALGIPVLCLVAADDTVVLPHNLDDLVALKPDAGVESLPGSHMALFHHAGLAAQHIVRFMERH